MQKREQLGAVFKEAYTSLNTAQKQAVDSIEGSVMVIAGPGTGKTQILTLRIANILLKTDVQPDNILALTFTDAGAQAMRDRLRSFIGPAAYQVNISTFHGFASRLISSYPDFYPHIVGGRAATDLERISLIEDILTDPSLRTLRPTGNPQYYVKPLLSMISDLKRENVTPEGLVKIIDEQIAGLSDIEQYHEQGRYKGQERGEYRDAKKSVEKNQALLAVYQRYEALLRERHLFDFDDMIIETVTALESNEDMLRDLQEQYQYILADEHQDVNGAQNRILELLASFHESPNIFVVGDEKQAIYRFQGASLENFLKFESLFPGATIISLTDNYRSGQPILDAAQTLITVPDEELMKLRVPLEAKAVNDAKVTERVFSHQVVEDAWVVAEIQAELERGTEPKEIAVIVRSNREVESFASLLRRAGVSVRASAESDILKHPVTGLVRALVTVVTNVHDMASLFRILHAPFWNISSADLAKALSAQRYDRTLIDVMSDESVLTTIGVQEPERFTAIVAFLDGARARAVSEAPHRTLEYLITESGLLAHLMERDPYEGGRVLRRLYDEVEALVTTDEVRTLQDVATQLTIREQYNLALTAPFINTKDDAVNVLTAHKSKGLEYEVVFVPHTVDSVWGKGTRRQNFKVPIYRADNEKELAIEDERRLFYVAMTRAKRVLHFSESTTSNEGKELISSQLKSELTEDEVLVVDTNDFSEVFDPLSEFGSNESVSGLSDSFIKTVLTERGFSATSLNNYLESPWNYLFRNVLQVPELQAPHLQFGTAIHNTLEQITRSYTKHRSVLEMSDIKRSLEQQLGRLPLSLEEFTSLLEKGLELLVVYREHLIATLPYETKEEQKIRVLFETGIKEVPEVPLTGKLDRIDKDKTGSIIRVVDYKTGKPKTRNVIEGKTKSSDGGYKRQLVFYALLMKLSGHEEYQKFEYMLSFVEPDTKGSVKEESFTVSDEEVSELEETIRGVIRELVSGDAFTVACDPEVCNYCDLAGKWS